MLKDSDFFNVLQNISTSLKNINENLNQIRISRKAEVDQFLKESKRRMRDSRILLNETQKRNIEENTGRMLKESKLSGNNRVNKEK